MSTYRVELTGKCREVYYVEADNEEDAATNWFHGDHELTEALDAEVTSVTEDGR